MSKNSHNSVSIALLGDVSLNGYWAESAHEPFTMEICEFIRQHDLVLLNLESPCKGKEGGNLLKIPRLHTTCEAVRNLSCLNPSVFVLGNNHVYDQLNSGVLETLRAIEEIGSLAVGCGFSEKEARSAVRLKINGIKISILSYVAEDTNPCLPPNSNLHLNWLDTSCIISHIREELAAGHKVIISLHWGVEGEEYPTPAQREIVQKLYRAGAHLVWGHHPHVIQGYEILGNMPAFYSMGNSCFDTLVYPDTASAYGEWSSLGRRSLVVTLRLAGDGIDLNSMRLHILKRENSKSQAVLIPAESVVDKLTAPFSYKIYDLFYKAYHAKMFMVKIWRYFFGPGRDFFLQSIKLPRRVLDEFN